MAEYSTAEKLADLMSAKDCYGEDGRRVFTPWERDFIESVAEQWDEREWLSERQLEIVDRLHREKV